MSKESCVLVGEGDDDDSKEGGDGVAKVTPVDLKETVGGER
jgi:hypothetical protein